MKTGFNKGAGQLRSNCEADQRLCFRYTDSTIPLLFYIQNFHPLDIFGACTACADPEIFMRGGPTKMVIFGHRRGGSNPQKIPKLPFFR